jgi:dienelactone hydrolase
VLGWRAREIRIRSAAVLWAAVALFGCAADNLVLSPAPGAADAGVLSFQSAGSLQRNADGRSFSPGGTPATISGELLFPEGRGPFPAVVLAHGCGGNRNVEPSWGPLLRQWGYATFNVDSFRGRGLNEVCTRGVLLVPLQRVPDAYAALRLLAAHPKIDPQRVALMGFSHGGALTMLAATGWAKDSYAAGGLPAFRAFFPFYPNCNAAFPERNRVSAPVRIHTGEADDWTPAKPCAELAAALKAAGQDVAIHVYPGANHAFDQARGYFYLPNVNNGASCFPQMASILGPVARGSAAGCLKKGATIGPSPSATEQARKNLHAQLDELMK